MKMGLKITPSGPGKGLGLPGPRALRELWLTIARGHARRDYSVTTWTRGDEAMLLRYADLGWTARAAVAAVLEPDPHWCPTRLPLVQ